MGAEFQTAVQVETPRAGSPARGPSRRRVFLVLFGSFMAMIAIAAGISGLAIRSWEGTLRGETERDLMQKARMFAADVNSDRTRNIATLASQEGQLAGARATVIDMNGKVIADSEVQIAALDTEGRTPEFASALRGETGVDVRSRSAFGIPVLYVAVPVSGGAVRLAYPLSDVSIASSRATRALVLGCALALVAALVISALASAQLSKPA